MTLKDSLEEEPLLGSHQPPYTCPYTWSPLLSSPSSLVSPGAGPRPAAGRLVVTVGSLDGDPGRRAGGRAGPAWSHSSQLAQLSRKQAAVCLSRLPLPAESPGHLLKAWAGLPPQMLGSSRVGRHVTLGPGIGQSEAPLGSPGKKVSCRLSHLGPFCLPVISTVVSYGPWSPPTTAQAPPRLCVLRGSP